MSQIKVSLYDQTAVFTETPDIFSGDIDVDTVKFTFDDSWNVYNKKTAIFYNDPKKSYPARVGVGKFHEFTQDLLVAVTEFDIYE